jgi:carboxypeptidase C (cathepsin A)
LTADPKLQVLSACGYYDLVCSYDANVYLANHLDADIARNVSAHGYGGGHAVYTDKNAQLELKRDVVKFMQNAVSSAPRRRPGRLPQKRGHQSCISTAAIF